MIQYLFILSLAFFSFLLSSAQHKAFTRNGNEFSFSSKDKDLKIEFCSPSLLRSKGKEPLEPNEAWMVVKYNWAPVNIATTENKNKIRLQSASLNVVIEKTSLAIEVQTKDGKVLSSEEVAGGGISKKGDTVNCIKKLSADEHFFDFGERMDFLDRRGKELKLNVGSRYSELIL